MQADFDDCDRILRALPEWFGIEESIVEYGRDLRAMETRVIRSGARVVGFLTMNVHNESTAEIHVMAIDPEWRRQGIGRSLCRSAEQAANSLGCQLLEVKTLGPSHPDPNYRQTRDFYTAMGFLPLEEIHDLWPGNPCLIMVKVLGIGSA